MKTKLIRVKTLIILCLITLLSQNSNAQTVYYIGTLAGNGTAGFSGDGGAATSSELNSPVGVAVDGSGNVYIADYFNNRIRKVNTSGTISTFAGNGTAGFSGDGGAATSAELHYPYGVAVDATGNVYIADVLNNRIRMVNTSGAISTVAGNGTAGFSGDGGAATSAELYNPYAVTSASGNTYIADSHNSRIRMVNTSGTISTIAGNGTAGFSGDGGSATSAELKYPSQLVLDASGNLYIADEANNRIRKVNTSGTISTIAGNGTSGFSGDGGAATSAEINSQVGLTIDASGNLYIGDTFNDRIRKVNTSGTISTIAGNGFVGFSGDGGVATSAELNGPDELAIDGSGNLYIPDCNNDRVRKLTPFTVSITAFSGRCNLTNGSLTATPSGGISPYSYSWAPNNTSYSGQNTSIYSGLLSSGTYTVTVTDNNGEQAIGTILYHCAHSPIRTGSNTLDDNQIIAYPNPTKGIFTLAVAQQGSMIEIYNNLGALLKTIKTDETSEELEVDVSNMPDGIYLIQIINTDGTVSARQKLVKIH